MVFINDPSVLLSIIFAGFIHFKRLDMCRHLVVFLSGTHSRTSASLCFWRPLNRSGIPSPNLWLLYRFIIAIKSYLICLIIYLTPLKLIFLGHFRKTRNIVRCSQRHLWPILRHPLILICELKRHPLHVPGKPSMSLHSALPCGQTWLHITVHNWILLLYQILVINLVKRQNIFLLIFHEHPWLVHSPFCALLQTIVSPSPRVVVLYMNILFKSPLPILRLASLLHMILFLHFINRPLTIHWLLGRDPWLKEIDHIVLPMLVFIKIQLAQVVRQVGLMLILEVLDRWNWGHAVVTRESVGLVDARIVVRLMGSFLEMEGVVLGLGRNDILSDNIFGDFHRG